PDVLADRRARGQGLGVRCLDASGLSRLLQRVVPERDPRVPVHQPGPRPRALQGAAADPALRAHARPQGELLAMSIRTLTFLLLPALGLLACNAAPEDP